MTEHALHVEAHPDQRQLGEAAAQCAAAHLSAALSGKGAARLMLAAAPSQAQTLQALTKAPGIDWSRVECFHMDDYLGLPVDAPQGFGNWLVHHFIDAVQPSRFHRIDVTGDPEQAAADYRAAMGTDRFDVLLCGFGVNGHLAFNDPPADFADELGARVITLDQVSRQQQVDEGHFPSLQAVPEKAVTVTIPRLLNSDLVVASVPGAAKRDAVRNALSQPVDGLYPATALRTHPAAHLFLDKESDPR